jgi:hypothetical protein
VTATSASPTSSIFAAPADAYVKPTRPASLDGPPNEDAAIDFAKYYLRMYTYAYLTGDAADLDALGRPGCVFCANVAADIAREYGAGGHDEGGVISVDAVRAVDYDVDGFYVVTMDARQAPHREIDGLGAAATTDSQARNGRYQFATYWAQDGGWRLAELSVSAE